MLNVANEFSRVSHQPIANPFKKESVFKIQLTIGKSLFKEEMEYKAEVYFRNDGTYATHQIKATDFNSLVEMTKNLIDQL